MTPIFQIQSEILKYLDEWKDFVWDLDLPNNFGPEPGKTFKARGGKFFRENRAEYASSVECLKTIRHMEHDGFPPDSYGFDFNQTARFAEGGTINFDVAKPILEKAKWLDDNLGNYLGYRFCALKMWYPADGYISWHTNWNVPGFNILFTYNSGDEGDGYWRHVDPTGSDSPVPNFGENDENVIHIPDAPGWSCKTGYYGKKHEHEKIIWHAAYTKKPRITLGYVVHDENLWKNTLEEIAGTSLTWPLAPYDERLYKFKQTSD